MKLLVLDNIVLVTFVILAALSSVFAVTTDATTITRVWAFTPFCVGMLGVCFYAAWRSKH
ncbi:MAG: hypothetical protein LUC43_02985 [Burkholderiales bacterium]|nr:hypothetical protein [Burkholderiales bacterium]